MVGVAIRRSDVLCFAWVAATFELGCVAISLLFASLIRWEGVMVDGRRARVFVFIVLNYQQVMISYMVTIGKHFLRTSKR